MRLAEAMGRNEMAARRVPWWCWPFIAPCAAAALLGISLGARAPVGDATVEGMKQMLAVVLGAAAAFGVPLLARLAGPLWARLGACAGLTAVSALALWAAWPAHAPVEWRRVQGASGDWSVELPAPPEQEERTAPTPEGEMPLREASATALGADFRVIEAEPPIRREDLDAGGISAGSLLSRARTQALRAGRERVLSESRFALHAVGSARVPARDVPALDLRFTRDGHDYRARLVSLPPRVFILSAGPLDEARPEAERFLGSFQLE